MAFEVLAPPLGQTTDTVVLAGWYKREGEPVKKGEPLFSIETDKATLDVEAPEGGVLKEIRAQAGDEVKVLSVIGVIAAPGEEISSSGKPVQAAAEPVRAAFVPASPVHVAVSDQKRVFISPRARRLAEENKVPLYLLNSTGPEGVIIERDVHAYLDQAAAEIKKAQPAAAPGVVLPFEHLPDAVPFSGIRARIAEKMVQSSTQTAPVTLTCQVDATELVKLRSKLADEHIEVSYNDLMVAITARALREHPRLNASLVDGELKLWADIHIAVAVDTDRGLLAPVVRNADRKGLGQLAQESHALIERARSGACNSEELNGSTFTFTNLGMFGIDAFTPIINLPECAVLGMGRIIKQPAVVDDLVVSRQMIWLSLTFDHRLIDGAPAARFLQRVAQLTEGPYLLLS
jgi:pyruvate dehydrogenase E2 component (dihydrolipoamide acetyltransferase)